MQAVVGTVHYAGRRQMSIEDAVVRYRRARAAVRRLEDTANTMARAANRALETAAGQGLHLGVLQEIARVTKDLATEIVTDAKECGDWLYLRGHTTTREVWIRQHDEQTYVVSSPPGEPLCILRVLPEPDPSPWARIAVWDPAYRAVEVERDPDTGEVCYEYTCIRCGRPERAWVSHTERPLLDWNLQSYLWLCVPCRQAEDEELWGDGDGE